MTRQIHILVFCIVAIAVLIPFSLSSAQRQSDVRPSEATKVRLQPIVKGILAAWDKFDRLALVLGIVLFAFPDCNLGSGLWLSMLNVRVSSLTVFLLARKSKGLRLTSGARLRRFPGDFAFQLTAEENSRLRYQTALTSPRFYRAGRGYAFGCAEQRKSRARKHRNHAGLSLLVGILNYWVTGLTVG